MSYHWREHAKRFTTPHQRHQLIMLRERLYGPYARATARWRALPDFLIIGAARSGTTHLFNTLRHHPEIEPARIKEVHFFDKEQRYQYGEWFYRSYFPLRTPDTKRAVVGEATPAYLHAPNAATRIEAMLPRAKLITLLRDPVGRFISGYYYQKQKLGREHHTPDTIEEYLESFDDLSEVPGISKGYYHKQLQRFTQPWQDGRLLVLDSAELFNDRQKALDKVAAHVGVDDAASLPQPPSQNRSQKKREVSAPVRERLRAHYAPHNEALYDWLGYRLNW